MKYITLTFISLWILLYSINGYAQQRTIVLHAYVKDDQNKEPLEFASVYMSDGVNRYGGVSDDNGQIIIGGIKVNRYKISISFLGYEKWEREIILTKDTVLNITLKSNLTLLDEIVVTASESRGLTSSSIIDRKAMQHLQPSSFTDLMELLPGGYSKDPNFAAANLIRIREIGLSTTTTEGDMSSLGTAFFVDGLPISTDANMQYVVGSDLTINKSSQIDKNRNITNRGVDMRSLSTDQIERVEVVRGIASVRYGDLTGGLVKIERKKGASPWEARFKADGISKLFSVGKGFNLTKKQLLLNMGIDFMDAKADPTNNFENYQRLNATARTSKKWTNSEYKLEWNSNFDLGHTLDDAKTDPDMGNNLTDSYKSTYNRFALANNFQWDFLKSSFLKSIELKSSVSLQLDKIKQTKLVQSKSPTYAPITTEAGVADGVYMPGKWISDLEVDGKPFSIFLQGVGTFNFKTFGVINNLESGLEWSLDKNYGKGQVYDPMRPPTEGMTTRPRAYSDIPSGQDAAFFLQDAIGIPVANNYFKINGGIRAMTKLNLESAYKMNGKFYIDPRINAEWTFPLFSIKDKNVKISFSGGIGWHSKFPTLNHLYPDFVYTDIEQLNYYHDNPDYRRINLMTYKHKSVNFDLEPARNRKWEVRLNLSFDKNDFSVTYFKERLNNGFRIQAAEILSQVYTKYLTDGTTLTGRPDLEDLASVQDTLLHGYSTTVNGSRILKEGIEFTFSSKRIESLKTRITINGAWIKNLYEDNAPIYFNPGIYLNGRLLREYGIFESDGGFLREQFNTNFTFDTYIPALDFEFSTSAQCMWFIYKKTNLSSLVPYAYVDVAGNVHPYTYVEQSDPILQWLSKNVSSGAGTGLRTPFAMNVNFKASKNFKDKMRLSLFVNKMLDYSPDYKVNGVTIRRSVSPYFGMELSFKL